MTTHFPNAPLIEIVAEVEWAPRKRPDSSDGEFDAYEYVGQSPHDRRLSAAFAAAGFTQIERLIPAGFEGSGPKLKFSNPSDPAGSITYKLGDTGLSVSAIPPYQYWDQFLPEIRRGLEIILHNREDDSHPGEFVRVTLNYVDAFGEDFWAGTSRSEFLTESLGFQLSIPKAFQPRLAGGDADSFFIDSFGKTTSGDSVAIKAGFATVLGEPKVILDITVLHQSNVPADVEAVISALETAHAFIHESFIDLTRGFVDVLNREVEK